MCFSAKRNIQPLIGRRSSIAGIHSELRRTNFTLHFTAEDEATCGGIAAGLPYGRTEDDTAHFIQLLGRVVSLPRVQTTPRICQNTPSICKRWNLELEQILLEFLQADGYAKNCQDYRGFAVVCTWARDPTQTTNSGSMAELHWRSDPLASAPTRFICLHGGLGRGSGGRAPA